MKVYYVKNKVNKGYPKAINQGIKTAIKNGNKYFLITNNDVVFIDNSIDELLKATRETNLGYTTAVDLERGLPHIGDIRFSDVLCNSCFLIRKETIEKIGYYDENLSPGNMEDFDYSYRMSLQGLEQKSVKAALINHKHGYTQKKYNLNSMEILKKNSDYLTKKHGKKLGWSLGW